MPRGIAHLPQLLYHFVSYIYWVRARPTDAQVYRGTESLIVPAVLAFAPWLLGGLPNCHLTTPNLSLCVTAILPQPACAQRHGVAYRPLFVHCPVAETDMSDVIAQLPEEAFDAISDHLLCQICCAPTDQWLRACNEHSFCAPCLISHECARERADGVAKCPVCRGGLVKNDVGDFYPDRTKNEMTLDQEVKCPHACGEILKLNKLKDHMQKTCENGIVPCPMAKFGCSVVMRRHEVDAHLKEDSHSHLAMGFFMKATESFREEVSGLKDTITTLQTTVKEQGDTITNLNSAIASVTASLGNNTSASTSMRNKLDTVERKLNEALSDGPHSLKQIAEQTKKRASPGQGQSERTKREKSQIQRQNDELSELRPLKKAGAATSSGAAAADGDISYSPTSPTGAPVADGSNEGEQGA